MKYKLPIVIILFFTIFNRVNSQSAGISIITNTKSGVWSDPTVWSGNSLPTDLDDVVLSNDITVDKPASCKSLNTNRHNLFIKSNNLLHVQGEPFEMAYHNQIVYPNNAPTSSSRIVAIYKEADLGYDFYFWGTSSEGKIDRITSVIVNRHNSYDSSMVFVLNDNQEVKNYFVRVKGGDDANIYRLHYQAQDSGYVMNRLYTNWKDTVLLMQMSFVFQKKDSTYLGSHYPDRVASECQGQDPSGLAKQAFRNVLKSAAGIALVAIGVAEALPVALIGAVLFYTSQHATISAIETAIGAFFGSADCGSETGSYSSAFAGDPEPSIEGINSSSVAWKWCACVFNIYYPFYPSQYNISFDNWDGVVFYQDLLGYMPAPECSGVSQGQVLKSRFFYLRPGATTTAYFQAASTPCIGNEEYRSSQFYECH